MTHAMNQPDFRADDRRVGNSARPPVGGYTRFAFKRPLLVSASSLAIAGLLGACATQPGAGAPAPDSASAQRIDGGRATRVLASLKDAETAVSDYARSLHRESALRQSVADASNAALVARHRASISTVDLLAAADAEGRLAAARRDLRMGEAATRAARLRLYRVLGLDDNTALNDGGGAAAVPVTLPLPDDRAARFAPDAAL